MGNLLCSEDASDSTMKRGNSANGPAPKRSKVDAETFEVAAGAFKSQTLSGYLAGAKEGCFYHVDRPNLGTDTPAYDGTLEALVEEKNTDAMKRMAKNKVKVCACGKAVAFTLAACNGCTRPLDNVPIGFSDNIFTGFMFGVRKGKFPYIISIRAEDAEYVCFDDLLALSPCHLNVIPTTKYIPDWRFLLKRPKEGLAVLEALYAHVFTVAREQFWGDEKFRECYLKKGTTVEELEKAVFAGFNYPPSQYQLHMQFITAPLVPFQYNAYLEGVHFTPRRFFPVDYVRAVLSLDVPYDVTDDTAIEDILAFYKDKGVDYDSMHGEFYARYDTVHKEFAANRLTDYNGVAVNGAFRSFQQTPSLSVDADGTVSAQAEADDTVDTKALVGEDKKTMQCYGRPYSNGRPSGVYYSFAKKSEEEVEMW